MSCLPGMPCYDAYRIAFPFSCGDPCGPLCFTSDKIIYNGPNLACTGIQSQDNLEVALQKIDERLCSDEFISHIIVAIENNPVLKEYFCQLASTCSFVPTTTTTTTTSNPCPTPTLNSVTTNGFGSITVNYSLNGSTGCTGVFYDVSNYPDFQPSSSGGSIPGGCSLTSYTFTRPSLTTIYVRIRNYCNGVFVNSNILPINPGNTTTTTTTTVTPTTTTTTTVEPTTTTTSTTTIAPIPPGTYTVGELALGGRIAYILQPGDPDYDPSSEHGIVVATSFDTLIGAEWGCWGTVLTGANGTAIGTGNQNTIDITTACSQVGIAAKLCNDLIEGGYSDWYLPSKDELDKLYLNRVAIGFVATPYWSSTESDIVEAVALNFFNNQSFTANKINTYGVRPIRKF